METLCDGWDTGLLVTVSTSGPGSTLATEVLGRPSRAHPAVATLEWSGVVSRPSLALACVHCASHSYHTHTDTTVFVIIPACYILHDFHPKVRNHQILQLFPAWCAGHSAFGFVRRVRDEGVRARAGRTIHWLQLAVIVSSIMQHHSRDQDQPDQCIVTPPSPISWIWPGHGHHYITADWRRKLKWDNASIRNHKQDIHIRVTNATVTCKAAVDNALAHCHIVACI